MEVEPSVQEQKGNKDNVDAIVAAIERRKASRLPSVERALTRPLGHRSDFVFGNRSSSADVDEYILEFLDPKDHASLAATSRALLRAVDKFPKFHGKMQCIILDNSRSMTKARAVGFQRVAVCPEMQQKLCENICRLVHSRSRMVIRLINKDLPAEVYGPEVQKLFRGCSPAETRRLLPTLLSMPLFYTGNSTPLFQAICSAIDEGFASITVISDGHHENKQDSPDLLNHLFVAGKSLQSYVDAHNAKAASWDMLHWKHDAPVRDKTQTFMKAVQLAIPPDKVSFLCIVGLGTTLVGMDDMVPVYSLSQPQEAERLARRVQHENIPREAGGGRGSQTSRRLTETRYEAARPEARTFIRKHVDRKWLEFPEADEKRCTSLLTDYRRQQWMRLEEQQPEGRRGFPAYLRAWNVPSKEERKGKKSWHFAWSGRRQTHLVAVAELQRTRERAMALFQDLTDTQKQDLLNFAAEETHKRYLKKGAGKKKSKSKGKTSKKKGKDEDKSSKTGRKRKSPGSSSKGGRSSKRAKKDEKDAGDLLLTVEHFRILLGPGDHPERDSLLARVPNGFYMRSVPVCFWLVSTDASGRTLHDRLLEDAEGGSLSERDSKASSRMSLDPEPAFSNGSSSTSASSNGSSSTSSASSPPAASSTFGSASMKLEPGSPVPALSRAPAPAPASAPVHPPVPSRTPVTFSALFGTVNRLVREVHTSLEPVAVVCPSAVDARVKLQQVLDMMEM